jgi:hypothetical protein
MCEKTQERKNRCPDSTQTKAQQSSHLWGLPCCAQALASGAQAWAGSSQWPALQLCAVLVLPRFYRFVRKILTVTPIPILFSPTRSIRQILSYFTEKSYFQISKTAYSRITYFPKTLKIIFSQILNFRQLNPKTGSNRCTMKVLRSEHCFPTSIQQVSII